MLIDNASRLKHLRSVFVERHQEIDLFENQINHLAHSNYELSRPVIDYWGMTGIGKSKLIKELYKRASSRGLLSVFIDFKDLWAIKSNHNNYDLYKLSFIKEL